MESVTAVNLDEYFKFLDDFFELFPPKDPEPTPVRGDNFLL